MKTTKVQIGLTCPEISALDRLVREGMDGDSISECVERMVSAELRRRQDIREAYHAAQLTERRAAS